MPRQFLRFFRYPGLSLIVIRHRFLFWSGAVAVALAAMLFAKTSVLGNSLFSMAIKAHPFLAFVITPAAFAGILWLTRHAFAGAEGSGIPQAIAALKIPVLAERRAVLSMRVAVGKILLTTLGLSAGASIGREGPTVQVGAAIMHALGRWMRMPVRGNEQALIIAGGAAGISAAFNTPLAGIVFAIEELSRSFEERTSGTMLTAVIVTGIASLALLGQFSGSTIYGTGYEEARGLIEGTKALPASFGLMKLGATILSYISGIPGGIFAPSLAIGAGLGSNVSHLMPGVPVGAVIILGMVGYFTGVVQAPITAVVIVMEMTDNQTLVIPLMATALIALGASRIVCPSPLYRTLAKSYLDEVVRRQPRPA